MHNSKRVANKSSCLPQKMNPFRQGRHHGRQIGGDPDYRVIPLKLISPSQKVGQNLNI